MQVEDRLAATPDDVDVGGPMVVWIDVKTRRPGKRNTAGMAEGYHKPNGLGYLHSVGKPSPSRSRPHGGAARRASGTRGAEQEA